MEELEVIVQRMIDAGESEENIALVIKEYNSKYEPGKILTTDKGAVVEDVVAPKVKQEDTVLQSVSGSSDLPTTYDYSIDGEEVTKDEFDKYTKEQEDKKDIGVIESLSGKLARGFASTGKGLLSAVESIAFGMANIWDQDMTAEERKALKQAISTGVYSKPTARLGSIDLQKAEDWASSHVRNLESESIYEAISKGNLSDAAELTVGGALESAPSILAAMTGYGGIALFGTSVAGNKFDEEFEKNPDESLKVLYANAAGNGVIEAGFELVTRGLLKKAGLIGAKSGKDVAKAFLADGAKSLVKKIGWSATQEGGSEAATEITSMLWDAYGGLDKRIEKGEFVTRVFDAGVIGAFMGGGVSTLGEIGGTSKAARNRAESLLTPIQVKEMYANASVELSSLMKDIQNPETTPEQKNILQKEVEKIQANIATVKGDVSKTLEGLNKEELVENFELINEIEENVIAYNEVKDKRTSKAKVFKQNIQDAQQRQSDLFKLGVERQLLKSIEFLEKNASKIKSEVEVLETAEEVIKKYGKDAGESDGFINTKTGKITINEEVALKQKAVSVGSHELLHGILFKAIGVDPDPKLIEEFKKRLTPEQRAVVQQRLEESYTEDQFNREYLTVFSDAVNKNQIKFKENIFTKIGDFITPILRAVGFKNIEFNNGKDVYDFMREYQKNIKQGKISKSVAKAVAEKEATKKEEELVKSVTADLNKKVDDLVGEKDADGNYKFKSKAEFQSSPEFVNVYDKVISGKMIDPLIRRGIEGDQVYGKPIENFIEEVKDGLTEVLMRFDPTENNSLIGFINSQLKFRKGDVLKKYKAQQAKSIDTAAGEVGSIAELEAEDNTEAMLEESIAEEKRQSGLIKAEEIIGSDEFIKAAKEEVASKLDQVKPDESTFKNVKGLAVETLAKEIGIPVKKIMDTTANMSSQEMGVSINWIKEHANQIAKIMPEGAVLDSASEKLLGTATGIANSILKNPRLYTKNPRVKKGAGLSPFVKNKNITGEDVLSAIGIVDGEPKPGIGPRTPEGQAVKGILAMYEKLVSNSLLRQELIDKGESSNVIQDIGAGKGDLMFSMSSGDVNLLKDYGIEGYKLESKKDIDKYVSDLRKLIPLLNTNDFKILNATVLQFSNLESKDLVKYLQSELKKLSKSKELARFVTISRTPVRKQFGSTFEDLKQKIKIPGYVQEYNEKNSLVFERMWNTINEILSDPKNKDLAPVIVTFLANSQIEKANPHRLGAPLVAYELADGRIDSYEHAMPSVEAYRRLIKASLDPNIDFAEEFEFVKNNYKLMAITKETDNKLLANGSNSFFDPKWKHWWQRYFNDKVAKDNGGINPENIFSIESKISLAEEFKINKEGNKDLAFSKNLNREFNDILEATTGVSSKKTYSKARAEMAGAGKGRFDFFIPPGAEDFVGLIYKTLGKGKIGEMQLDWYKRNFFEPYARAMAAVTKDRVIMAQKFKALRKELKIVPKDLRKKIPGEGFTREQAIRVYIWNKQGAKIPGLNEGDISELTGYVKENPELVEFADRLIAITGKDAYVDPKEGWMAGTITTDLLDTVNGSKRAMHLEQWQENVDAVFTEDNLNKLEALYGKSYRVALENILKRMKSGRNRLFTSDSLTGRFVDWISNSIGSIMFFNSRSAVLQTISAVNFINFTDNNILAAGKALANPKQFTKDFMTLMNSEFLVDRRNGLRINVNEADIANIAATSKNKAKAIISEILKAGFLPTQIADSFAIASGGAAFYRNRINTYTKQGLNQETAEQNAMRDFREIAEESQQSSRPDKISQQQAGPLGRIILAFANTPAQYARIIKKATLDLKNGRGDAKTNISKIIYYAVAQNLLFSAMQNALFALAFEDDDEEENEKYGKVANSMADSLLRGMGFAGAATSVIKNALIRIVKESEKDVPKYEKAAAELLKISPPISSKLSKVESALRSASWDKDKIKEAGLSIDNPALMIGGKMTSAAFNVPLDRALIKINNIQNAMSKETEVWQKLALLGGWQDWELGIEEEKKKKSKNKKTITKRKIKKKTIEKR